MFRPVLVILRCVHIHIYQKIAPPNAMRENNTLQSATNIFTKKIGLTAQHSDYGKTTEGREVAQQKSRIYLASIIGVNPLKNRGQKVIRTKTTPNNGDFTCILRHK
jgi:hypothetical protein